MSKYRDRLKIVADILLIVSGRAKKTRIMYQANLSYRLLCRYLSEVVDADLIRSEDDDCYVLTAKGKEFLSQHEEYAKRCQGLEEQLDRVSSSKVVLEEMISNINAHKRARAPSRSADNSKKRVNKVHG